MDKEPQDDLELFIHQELQRLPALEAPADLTARVQRALQQRQHLHWWQRSWSSWPRAVRAISLFFLTGLGMACCLAPWFLPVGALSEMVGRWREAISGNWQWVDAVVGAAALVVKALANSPYLWLMAGITLVGYLTVIGLGTFLVRFAGRPGYRGGGL